MAPTVGFLHPGAMGSAMAHCCTANALWASQGRSAETRALADQCAMTDVVTIEAMADAADIIVSICPPDRALEMAEAVAGVGFGGLYVDANAISPATAAQVGSLFESHVDASVVGLPPDGTGRTRLYLSGAEAQAVADLWVGTDLEPVVLTTGGDTGASALKMAYAGWTKAGAALLFSVAALAEHHGVAEALAAEWDRSQPGLVDRLSRSSAQAGPKAWRFAGEMVEIADTMVAAGIPDGLHRGAEAVFTRLAELKGADRPTPAEVVDRLLSAAESFDQGP